MPTSLGPDRAKGASGRARGTSERAEGCGALREPWLPGRGWWGGGGGGGGKQGTGSWAVCRPNSPFSEAEQEPQSQSERLEAPAQEERLLVSLQWGLWGAGGSRGDVFDLPGTMGSGWHEVRVPQRPPPPSTGSHRTPATGWEGPTVARRGRPSASGCCQDVAQESPVGTGLVLSSLLFPRRAFYRGWGMGVLTRMWG